MMPWRLLLAQDRASRYDAIESLRRAFSRTADFQGLALALAAIATLLLVVMLLDRWLRRTKVAKVVDYLTIAVDLLDLSEIERRDLRTLVKRAGIDEPASILLSPANLVRALEAASARQCDPRLHARVAELGQRLFGHPLPAAKPAAATPPRAGPMTRS